jgi:hypothetical protein
MRKSVTAAVIMAGLMPLAACAGGQASSMPSAAAAAECLDATNIAMNGIMKGATGEGMTFVSAKAIKSPDFAKVYFIAMKFSAAGVEDQVGVWASNSLEPGGGLIMAIDGVAQQFSDWGPGSSTAAKISAADPSVAAAESCLR